MASRTFLGRMFVDDDRSVRGAVEPSHVFVHEIDADRIVTRLEWGIDDDRKDLAVAGCQPTGERCAPSLAHDDARRLLE